MDDKCQGKEIYTYVDKRSYDGARVDDKMHGMWKLKDRDGHVIHEGKFENEELQKYSRRNI